MIPLNNLSITTAAIIRLFVIGSASLWQTTAFRSCPFFYYPTQAFSPLATTVRRISLTVALASKQSTTKMPRGIKKQNLPEKVCVVCKRPFTWRKKWETVWDEVTTCSKSCNAKRRAQQQAANRIQRQEHEHEKLDNNNNNNNNNNISDDPEKCRPSQPSGLTADQESLAAMISVLSVIDDDEQVVAMEDEQFSLSNSDSNSSNATGASASYSDMDRRKEARKALRKQTKAHRRDVREGRVVGHAQKECTVCHKSVDLLIRCTIDQTASWNMVCGKCWHDVSGGVVDGDGEHPHYRYGGLWKNRTKR
jgi:hypothetical protein